MLTSICCIRLAFGRARVDAMLQGPISINVLAGAGGVLADNIQSSASSLLDNSAPRMIPQQRGVLKTLV